MRRDRPFETIGASGVAGLIAAVAIGAAPGVLDAQQAGGGIGPEVAPAGVPEWVATSRLRDHVDRYATDRNVLFRRWDADYSPHRADRFRAYYQQERDSLHAMDFEALGLEGRVDWVLLDNQLRYRLELLDRESELLEEMHDFLPFIGSIWAMHEARRAHERIEGREQADRLVRVEAQISGMPDLLRQRAEDEELSRIVALRSLRALEGLQRTLGDWYEHYAGYDPLFTWWVEEPYGRTDEAMDTYAKYLREEVIGFREGEDEPIVGDPIGAEALAEDLRYEMIAYTPEELIEIAETEFAWLEARMLEASRDLGYGDDWKAALEHVKTLHVEPGEQPELVRMLAQEAVDFLREHDLVTIPDLAVEVWRMSMMSPERQKEAPFFLGGEVVQVSFPTDGMAHEDKLMSMRGNNIHFSRAVVHHELIPGHHLQGFMTQRYNSHRNVFGTPFWHEGGALYWEMRLWDLDFPQSAEDRVGMLFWRMHRAARIIFSLGFHLGEMTPQEAIVLLVDRVGHERANAEAEVRRSFNGSYSPVYQAAYMLGGLQIRSLHEELVGSGRMTDREFHDAILQGGRMPIEMVRARLLEQPPVRDFEPSWRFYDGPGEP